MIKKGIILAGGRGTRLYPLSQVTSKQLFPIFDKPMIYYPMSTLISLGIKEILIISTNEDLPTFKKLFSDGKHLGLEIKYKQQDYPNGIAEAFIIGEEFINNKPVALILGDNLFHGATFINKIQNKIKSIENALILGYPVKYPQMYGVLEFDENKKIVDIIEKPENPPSHYAVPGLYFFDKNVTNYAKLLAPSQRGELEITDLNRMYLYKGSLEVELIDSEVAWLDTGTHQNLLEAGKFIETFENRQGIKIGCIEEVCFNNKLISIDQLNDLADNMPVNEYSIYIKNIINKRNNIDG